MIKVYGTEKKPIKSWVTDIEDGALDQAKNMANLPFVFKHVALMPDAHYGFGMPIGGVMATEGVIIPNAVGVDIGCGMCATKTSIKHKDMSVEQLKQIMGIIRENIPVGFKHRIESCDASEMPNLPHPNNMKIVKEQFESARKQLGTLGGGNHFIEIQKDEEDFVWIMIHSGSRNIGFKSAAYYNNLAKALNKKWCSSIPEKHDLAFLPLDSQEGKDYLAEMKYCVEFALANRKKMMDDVQKAMIQILGEVKFEEMINIAHNYAKLENHFGKNVVVHRKGATSAQEGEIGIIPGSQGTCSYIVRGLGNPESFKSCSHGAGRTMGRNEARRTLDLEKEKEKLDSKGIIHSIRSIKDLDEATGAYKDINVVMENQKDLAEIVTKLFPLAVVKG